MGEKAVGLLEWIKSGNGSSGNSAENMQEYVKKDITRAVLRDLRVGIALVMAAGSSM